MNSPTVELIPCIVTKDQKIRVSRLISLISIITKKSGKIKMSLILIDLLMMVKMHCDLLEKDLLGYLLVLVPYYVLGANFSLMEQRVVLSHAA
jgi:hypothetical protein